MPACPNCAAPLDEPLPVFCPHCGQETRVRPPTLGEFLQQFGGAYLSTEGALWRTLALLVRRPGELTRQYLAGRRKHYVLPLRLYLTASLLGALLMQWVVPTEPPGAAQDKPGGPPVQIENRNGTLTLGPARVGFDHGRFVCSGMPQAVCERFRERLDVTGDAALQRMRTVNDRVIGHVGAVAFCLLPLFAALTALLWWDRRLRYTEHLVFALHLHAYVFLTLGLMVLPGVPEPLRAALVISLPVHAALALRRVFGGRWWSWGPRAAALGVLYLIALSTVMAGAFVVAVLA